MTSYENLTTYPDVLNLEEASGYLGASKDTIRKLCRKGGIKHFKVGKLYKFTKQNIIDFLENKN